MTNPVMNPAPSPCINICQMDEASGWCRGCFRTLDEIGFWSVLDEEDKQAVLALLPPRRAQGLPPAASPAA